MGRLAFLRPADNLVAGGTLSVSSGTADAEFPVANLGNLNPANPAKFTTTTGRWVIDLGSALEIDLVWIGPNNLDSGLAGVKIEANATDSWGGPSLSQTITIPTFDTDRFSINPFLDLTGVSPRSFRFWSLVFTSANSFPLAVGEWVLSTTIRQFSKNIDMGLVIDEDHPMIEHRTDLGVTAVFRYGTKWRTLRGGFLSGVEADLDAMRSLQRDAGGRGKAFLVIPDQAINEAWFVRLTPAAALVPHRRRFQRWHEWPFEVQEVGRGLTLIDPTQS